MVYRITVLQYCLGGFAPQTSSPRKAAPIKSKVHLEADLNSELSTEAVAASAGPFRLLNGLIDARALCSAV